MKLSFSLLAVILGLLCLTAASSQAASVVMMGATQDGEQNYFIGYGDDLKAAEQTAKAACQEISNVGCGVLYKNKGTGWLALAWDPDKKKTAYGWALGKPFRSQAQLDAESACTRRGGKKCVSIFFEDRGKKSGILSTTAKVAPPKEAEPEPDAQPRPIPDSPLKPIVEPLTPTLATQPESAPLAPQPESVATTVQPGPVPQEAQPELAPLATQSESTAPTAQPGPAAPTVQPGPATQEAQPGPAPLPDLAGDWTITYQCETGQPESRAVKMKGRELRYVAAETTPRGEQGLIEVLLTTDGRVRMNYWYPAFAEGRLAPDGRRIDASYHISMNYYDSENVLVRTEKHTCRLTMVKN